MTIQIINKKKTTHVKTILFPWNALTENAHLQCSHAAAGPGGTWRQLEMVEFPPQGAESETRACGGL